MLPFGMAPVNDDMTTTARESLSGGSARDVRRRHVVWRVWSNVKLLLPIVILGLLLRHLAVSNPESMREVWNRPKSWPGLTLAALMVVSAVLVSLVRWYVLAAAIRLPFSIGAAIRLGCIGCFMNFVSAGGVGGDLFQSRTHGA